MVLSQMRAGDEHAVARLFELVHARLSARAEAMLSGFPSVRNQQEAGDIISELWLSLRRALLPCDPKNSREFFGMANRKMHQLLLDLARRLRGRAKELFAVGREIDGYKVTGILGEGGCGVVFSAVESMGGRQVVIKVFANGASHTTLQKEYAALEALHKASHVPDLLRCNQIEEIPYLVMTHEKGISLAKIISESDADGRRARLAPVLRGITEALAEVADVAAREAADTAIVHGDIKPANILVQDDGRAVLLDFSIARHLRKQTAVQQPGVLGNLIGYTHDYLVPEVVLDSHSTVASDIFQVGLVGYELATGQKYWQVDRSERLARMKDSIASASLRGVLCRCLSWEPDGRYRSAKAMLTAVKRCSA